MEEAKTRTLLQSLLDRKAKADSLSAGEIAAHQAVYDLMCRRISAYMVQLLVKGCFPVNAQLHGICAELVDIITRQDGPAFFKALAQYEQALTDPLYQMGFQDYEGDVPWQA